MKHLLAILCALGLVTSASARIGNPGHTASLPKASAAGGGNPPASPLIAEDFEGTGYEEGGAWAEGGFAAKDEDYAGADVILGSQSLEISAADSESGGSDVTFSGGAERWFFGEIKITTSRNGKFLKLYSSGYAAELASIAVQGSTFRAACGAVTDDTVATFSTGTVIYWWVRYLKGSGVNAVVDFRFSTTTTKPADGSDNQALITLGTATADVAIMSTSVEGTSGSAFRIIHDHIYVDDEDILSNP